MNREDLIKAVNEILINEFELEPGSIHPDAKLYEDLEIDSLDGIDMIVALEKKFKIRADEKRGRSIRTVNDVYDFAEEMATLHGIDSVDPR